MTISFTDFLLLEKASNSEISDAINDPNILVGLEFEFTLTDSEATGYGGWDWDDLDGFYEDYWKECVTYFEDLQKEMKVGYIKDAKRQLMPYRKKLLEERIGLQKEIKKYTALLDNWATTNPDEINQKIGDIENEITVIENKENILKDLFKSGNGYEFFSYVDENNDDFSFSLDLPINYAVEEAGREPTTASALDDFYSDVAGIYIGHSNAIRDWIGNNPDTEIDQESAQDLVYQFFESLEIVNPSAFADGMENDLSNLEDYQNWDDLPFDNYEIGGYHSNSTDANTKFWRIEEDSSLTEPGVEIISPPMTIKEMYKIIPKMFKFISDHGMTDNSAGLHVNMSYKGKKWENLDELKLMMFIDEGWVWKYFTSRQANSYARSVLDYIKSGLQSNPETLYKNIPREKQEKLDTIVSNYRKVIKGPNEKFFGINTSNYNIGPSGRIEFRYMGGRDYHKKESLIKTEIGKYGAYLKIAMDPTYRKNEYLKKLQKMYDAAYDDTVKKLSPFLFKSKLPKTTLSRAYNVPTFGIIKQFLSIMKNMYNKGFSGNDATTAFYLLLDAGKNIYPELKTLDVRFEMLLFEYSPGMEKFIKKNTKFYGVIDNAPIKDPKKYGTKQIILLVYNDTEK